MVTPECESTSIYLRDAIAQELLDPLRNAFQSRQRVHFIVDTPSNDGDFLQEYIMTQIRTQLGEPFAVDFADVGSGATLVQDLLAMIFLRSEFPSTLLRRKRFKEQDGIFRVFVEKTNRSLSEIAQRYFECRRLNDRQKNKLGVNSDLSEIKNAIKFFVKCVDSYSHYSKRVPVFYFRNAKLEKHSLKSHATIRFLKDLQEQIPCVFLLKVQRDFEYVLLYVEDFCSVIRLQALSCADLDQLVTRICESLQTGKKLDFTKEGLREFCNVMRHIHGKTVSAAALAKALLDVRGHAMLRQAKQISEGSVRELFSVETIKIQRPTPRQPRISLSPYFGDEIERLTRQCEALGLDPHYALPWNFKMVMRYINYGSLRYCCDDDTFETLRYIGHGHWLELDSALRLMGYRYSGGGKWIFSPRPE